MMRLTFKLFAALCLSVLAVCALPFLAIAAMLVLAFGGVIVGGEIGLACVGIVLIVGTCKLLSHLFFHAFWPVLAVGALLYVFAGRRRV